MAAMRNLMSFFSLETRFPLVVPLFLYLYSSLALIYHAGARAPREPVS